MKSVCMCVCVGMLVIHTLVHEIFEAEGNG